VDPASGGNHGHPHATFGGWFAGIPAAVLGMGLAILMIFALYGIRTACAQSAIGNLQPLVETSARMWKNGRNKQ